MTQSSAPTLPGRDYSNLDLLRACAVLFVFFAHLTAFHGLQHIGPFSLFGLGIWGVLIFFVHTSFVLMLSLQRQWRDQGSRNLFANFMVRRSFRILPLSILAVALVAIFRLPLMYLAPHHFIGAVLSPSIVAFNLLLVQNLPKAKISILGPLWSLPYEMQMYLFLPLLFLFVRSAKSVWRLLVLWVLAVGLAILAMRNPEIPWLARYIPCFLPGIMAYQIHRKKVSQLPSFLWPTLIAALTAFYLTGEHPDRVGGPRDWVACLILGLLVPRFAQISTHWVVTASHIIAKYSYGIYLTHFFAIWFAMEKMAHSPTIYRLTVLIVLAAVLPVLFYHAIEEPMIRLGKRLTDRRVAPAAPSQVEFPALSFGKAEANTQE